MEEMVLLDGQFYQIRTDSGIPDGRFGKKPMRR